MQIPSISFPILYNPSTNILSKQNHNHFSIPKVPLLSLHMTSLLNPSSSEGIIVKSITPYVQRTCESNSNGIDQRKNNRTKSEATNELVTWFTSSPGHVEGCAGTHKMCPQRTNPPALSWPTRTCTCGRSRDPTAGNRCGSHRAETIRPYSFSVTDCSGCEGGGKGTSGILK